MGLCLHVESGEVPASPGTGDEAEMPCRLQNLRLQYHMQPLNESQKRMFSTKFTQPPLLRLLSFTNTFYRSLRRRWVFLEHVDDGIFVVVPFSLSFSFHHFERHLIEVALETARFD